MRASDACHNRELTPQNQHRHEERTEIAKTILGVRFFLFSSYDSDRDTFGSALHQVSRAALPACMAA